MTFWNDLLRRPQQLALRRFVFQIHLWVGIGVGLYILMISVTGSALVFRDELKRTANPNLFLVADTGKSHVSVPEIVNSLKAKYPNSQVAGIYSPTATRQSFLAYVSGKERFAEVLVHPQTAAVLGELPESSFWAWLQDLHFNLFAGNRGRVVNGLGGLLVLVMGITGLFIWWQGVDRWTRALRIDFRGTWKRWNWDLHNMTGFWTFVFLMLWGFTGAYFAWPRQFRAIVNWFSPVTVNAVVTSDPSLSDQEQPPDVEAMIDQALKGSPERAFWGILFPLSDRATYQITTATIAGRNEWDNTDHIDFYFDRFSGALLERRPRDNNTAGDVIMSWIAPAHFGTFGGIGIKVLWLIFGLAPSLLFVTGSIMWWNRVVSERWSKVGGKSSKEAKATSIPTNR